MKQYKDSPELIRPDIFKKNDGIKAWFTCKNADLYSANQKIAGLNLGYNTSENTEVVSRHRKELLDSLNIDIENVAFAEQVHGSSVQTVTKGGIYDGVDALISRTEGITLAIQVADCAAVLMADPDRGIIAAVHAGWRGAADDIIPKTVDEMISLGAKTTAIKAFISPCISQANFEVGEEVAERFPTQFVDYKTYKKPHVNLKKFLVSQLSKLGLKPSNIEVNEGCTVEDANKFYSYRREQQASGRMLGIIRNTIEN
ncbi:MAG: peptidoglycan editing factor PgeF [Candidatus Halalkalibacterium sp. M3_1C_030]